MDQEVEHMCYEFWRHEQVRTDEDKAKRQAQEMIEKAKAGKAPRPERKEPAVKDKEKEPVPA
jgi:hypothetical protein